MQFQRRNASKHNRTKHMAVFLNRLLPSVFFCPLEPPESVSIFISPFPPFVSCASPPAFILGWKHGVHIWMWSELLRSSLWEGYGVKDALCSVCTSHQCVHMCPEGVMWSSRQNAPDYKQLAVCGVNQSRNLLAVTSREKKGWLTALFLGSAVCEWWMELSLTLCG